MKTILYFILTLLTFVTLAFVPNSFAQDASPEYVIRVIYFLPNDRQSQPGIDTELDTLLKDIQQFYADEMERHGFDRKSFRLETNNIGTVLVHRVNGRFSDGYYHNNGTYNKVMDEINEQYDRSKHLYFVALDISSSEGFEGGGRAKVCGLGGNPVLITASGFCMKGEYGFIVAAHELGHNFGLAHDFHNDSYLMSYGILINDRLSKCNAEWLNAHHYFNTSQNALSKNTKIQMSPPSLASPPDAIRLRFEVNDPDGLHQAQLLTPATDIHEALGFLKLLDCKSLNGSSNTIEFITTELVEGPATEVWLQVMDRHGNIIQERFEVNIISLLPPSEVVSLSDTNLAAAIRKSKSLSLTPGNPITQLDMLGLRHLDAYDASITNLTGLEHAKNLKYLYLSGNKISDITVLGQLPNLAEVFLGSNQISDITPLAKPTNLLSLGLRNNKISNVSPLAELQNLRKLDLFNNQISDVSPLTELINLEELHLERNPIKDRKPLLDLLEKNPDVKIYLERGGEPLPVTLSHFRAEHTDAGVVLKWTTESELDNAGFYIHRSETKNGEFKVVNPTLIQGAGTTSERNEYTWKDTTAKPNVAYYYQIEDISHAGVRKQLATVRMRGLVSATGKLTTRWADLKTQN